MQGSRIYKDNIAAANDALIDVLEDSGAIIIGKTNTPEFGAGANTFNEYTALRFTLPAMYLELFCAESAGTSNLLALLTISSQSDSGLSAALAGSLSYHHPLHSTELRVLHWLW